MLASPKHRYTLIPIGIGVTVAASLVAAMYPGSARTPPSSSADFPTSQSESRVGPPFMLEFASITSGGSVQSDGTIMVVGQHAIGAVSNEQYTLEIGAVPVLLALTTGTGDLNEDGLLTIEDFGQGFWNCFAGPRTPYSSSPYCWRFDMNRDGDVDVEDFRRFQVGFGN